MDSIEKSRFDILLIDDDANVLNIVKRLLSEDKYNIVTATNGREGIEKLVNFYPDIIICDIVMPLMDGYEFRDAIRERDEYYLTSFIFMSAKSTTDDKVRGLQHGVDAYITKPFNLTEFKAIVDSMIAKRIQLERLVNHDALTRLFNKRKIINEFERELLRVRRYGHLLSVFSFDIDFFKKVNDTYGHPEGDLVLETLAKVAREVMREIDMLGRIGGEEFLFLLPETDKEGALRFAERFRERIKQVSIGENNITITISGGIVTAPADGDDRTELLRKVDNALYEAKHSGRDKVLSWEK